VKDDSDTCKTSLIIKQIDRLSDIDKTQWNKLAGSTNPFLSFDYLNGLEQHHCLDGHGWKPMHLVIFDGKTAIGALPTYLKDNSYGEFVFDWSWADAYERAGGRYYPKLVSTIPFAPVQGPRFLVNDDRPDKIEIKEILLKSVIKFAEKYKLSSFHCLFPLAEDLQILEKYQQLTRMGFQYHWHNYGYENFQGFLDTLTSKKRKQIKRERRQIKELEIDIEVIPGKEVTEEQWEVFYGFYCSTFHRRWGAPRLTYDFFLSLSENLPEQTLLIMAKKERRYVAGAFAMLGNDTLYGRHWGCDTQYPNLHFELCYYQTIDYCIKHGLKTLDAGVQGEHKLNRGFEPTATWSSHWISNAGFRDAIDDFLQTEKQSVNAYIDELNNHLPYKEKVIQA
jgi:predicted N-acyltransferase